MMNPLYAQYNASHRSNYEALQSANFPSYTMLCPGFMLDQPFDPTTSPPPLECERNASHLSCRFVTCQPLCPLILLLCTFAQ